MLSKTENRKVSEKIFYGTDAHITKQRKQSAMLPVPRKHGVNLYR